MYGDATKWTLIYRANKDQLRTSGAIYPGQILAIPKPGERPEDYLGKSPAKPSVDTWVVKEGETLASIACQPEVYRDFKQWTRIFEANRNKLSEPERIYPGMRLAIPQ